MVVKLHNCTSAPSLLGSAFSPCDSQTDNVLPSSHALQQSAKQLMALGSVALKLRPPVAPPAYLRLVPPKPTSPQIGPIGPWGAALLVLAGAFELYNSWQRSRVIPIVDAPPRATPIDQWIAEIHELGEFMQRVADLQMMMRIYEMLGFTSLAQDLREELEVLQIQMTTAANAYPVMGNRLEIRATAAAIPASTAEPVDLHADETVRNNQLDAALAPLYLYGKLGFRNEHLVALLKRLYLYLLEQGDTHNQIIDRILTLKRTLMMADRHVDNEDITRCLGSLPNAFTAWRYNNVQKEDAWAILLQQAKRSGSQTPKLWEEYSHYIHPSFHWGSFNIHFIYSAYTIRRALIVNDNIRHDQKNTFAILDRFAEMGWTDDEVVALVDAMTGAISNRNTSGLEFGYRDHLERSQFILLPSVVAALGGRDPERRPAIVATIAQMTRDTGQHFLDLGMQSIVQLAAAGKIRPDKQITITNAAAWERYVQKIFSEGMPHPLLSDAGPGNFERRFGYLKQAPTSPRFWKAFHEAQKIIQLYIQSVDSPAAYTAWKKFSDIGWTPEEVGNLMRAVAYLRVGWVLIERHLENDHLQLLPDVVTAMGGENPKHRPAIIKAMGHFHPEHFREEKILVELQDLARFWGVPTTGKPETVEKHILNVIRGIADSNYSTWRRVARAVGDNKEKMASLREGIQARAKRDDENSPTAVRALDKLPRVFKNFEL